MTPAGSGTPPARPTLGTLDWGPALERPELLAAPVANALHGWPHAADVAACAIDPDLVDTAEFSATYQVPLQVSANCVVVAGRRGGEERVAACVVLATTRADVNGVVRKLLDVRKASFLAMDAAVERTGMEYGGITPIGLPADWPVLVDAAVPLAGTVVVGSGLRRSKVALRGTLLAALPGAQVVEGLAR